MNNYLLFALPGNDVLAHSLADKSKIELGLVKFHVFPDGEDYLRVESDVKNKIIILVCTLDHPDAKILRLLFLAQTLRELGATEICLLAPYLPYMRQDKHFQSGDALTSTIFAKLLSSFVDRVITIDPHLHRIHNLAEIYSVSNITTLHASKKIAEWISAKITSPFIIGPDEESKQWVREVAEQVNASYAIISKIRHTNGSVDITLPDFKDHNKNLILVDDIISSGATMLTTLRKLDLRGFKNINCIGIHALFDKTTYNDLLSAGATRVVSCNTIPHFSNEIDLADLINDQIQKEP